MSNYKRTESNIPNQTGGAGEISFVNASGQKVVSKEHVECHRCKKKGHYASECTNERVVEDPKKKDDKKAQSGTALLTYGGDDFDDQPEATSFQFMNVGEEEEEEEEEQGRKSRDT